MPQRKCALKRLRIDKKRKIANLKIKSELKKELKALRALITQAKSSEAIEKMKITFSKLDRAAAKGLIHKNTAARRKSRLMIKLNSLKEKV